MRPKLVFTYAYIFFRFTIKLPSTLVIMDPLYLTLIITACVFALVLFFCILFFKQGLHTMETGLTRPSSRVGSAESVVSEYVQFNEGPEIQAGPELQDNIAGSQGSGIQGGPQLQDMEADGQEPEIKDGSQLEDKKADGESSGVQVDSQLQDMKDDGQGSEVEDGSQPRDINAESRES